MSTNQMDRAGLHFSFNLIRNAPKVIVEDLILLYFVLFSHLSYNNTNKHTLNYNLFQYTSDYSFSLLLPLFCFIWKLPRFQYFALVARCYYYILYFYFTFLLYYFHCFSHTNERYPTFFCYLYFV